MSKYLISFHLGPVQDFIAAARRTQDLWMGSWLLSYLSRVAIETGLKNPGAELLIPAIPLQQGASGFQTADADTTNHFLLRVTDADAKATARAIETAVGEKWRDIHTETKRVFFPDVNDDLWSRQVNRLLEIFWAIVPDDGTSLARRRAQNALDARKRLRAFKPVNEPHLKCSLCGLRQEASGRAFIGEARDWWIDLVKLYLGRQHLQKLRIRPKGNERLCAVCAVKRAALAAKAVPLQSKDGHFPSTSSIAAAIFKRELLTAGRAGDELAGHLDLLEELGITAKVNEDCLPALAVTPTTLPANVRQKLLMHDGDAFYVETFTEKRFQDDYPEAEAAYADLGADSLRGLLRAVRRDDSAQPILPPSKYYAALAMDGDHMGAFFGSVDDALARKLSDEVAGFARAAAKQIVNQHCGRLVYAGGDDLLALVPLATAFACARELQRQFKEAVATAMATTTLPSGLKAPTPSAGLAIAQHTSPLDLALQAMRRAESAAKQTYGRDALCVHLLKRSGEEVRVGTHWAKRNGGNLVEWLGVFEQLTDLLSGEILSMKFAGAVAAEASGLAALPLEAQASELKRLARRQKGAQFQQALHEGDVMRLMDQLGPWAKTEVGSEDEKRVLGMEEVAQWILLARFIASGGSSDE